MKHKTKRFRIIKGKIVWSKTFSTIETINQRKLAKMVAKRNAPVLADVICNRKGKLKI